MENNIEILENIMKPYFDKKKEIESVSDTLENNKKLMSKEIHNLKTSRIERRKELEVELENLRVRYKVTIEDFKQKQEREIDEYIEQLMGSNPHLSATYASFIRKDLEQQYNKKSEKIENDFKLREEQLISEIKLLKSVSEEEKNEKNDLSKLNNSLDFSRVDLREMVELKDELRKKLFAERKRLNLELLDLKEEQELYEKTSLELNENQLNLIQVMDKLSNFKYEYNDQNQVVNSDEWRKLYEESNLISTKIQDLTKLLLEKNSVVHKINDINKSLERVEEYISLTELTKEETASVMMSMTPWERKEYDRRKSIKSLDIPVEDVPQFINIYDLEFVKAQNAENKSVTSKTEQENFFETAYEGVMHILDKSPKIKTHDVFEVNAIDDENTTSVDSMEDLYTDIYNDIAKELDTMKAIRMILDDGLNKNKRSFEIKENGEQNYVQVGVVDTRLDSGETIELPSGELLSENDIIEGIEKIYNKNDHDRKTYVVEGSQEENKFSKNYVNKIKQALKKCTALKLVKEKTLQETDLIRVHGKEKVKNFFKKFNVALAVEKNTGEKYEGNYIEKEDAKKILSELINKKSPYWTKKILAKLNQKRVKNQSEPLVDIESDDKVKIR